MAVLLANGVMKKRLTLVVRRFRWLEDNAVEPYRFVIIDDFSTIEVASGQEDFWITVNPHCGISKKDANRAIQLLNQQ